MILNKPNAIIYIRRDSLIVAGRKVKPARLNFPPDIIKNLEIYDEAKFKAGCRDFFDAHDLKGKRVVIVLDDQVIFTKVLPANVANKPAAAQQAFVSAMPYRTGVRACVRQQTNEGVTLYATNARLYQVIAAALQQSNVGKLLAVTPAAAYGVSVDTKLTAAIEAFVTSTSVHNECDFLSSKVM